jgi:hypothetical protein
MQYLSSTVGNFWEISDFSLTSRQMVVYYIDAAISQQIRWHSHLVEDSRRFPNRVVGNKLVSNDFAAKSVVISLISLISIQSMTSSANLASKMDVDEAAIDEGLYSRQL